MTDQQLAQEIQTLETELSRPLQHPDLAPWRFFRTLHLASLRRLQGARAEEAKLRRTPVARPLAQLLQAVQGPPGDQSARPRPAPAHRLPSRHPERRVLLVFRR